MGRKKKYEYQKLLDLLNEYENPMVSWYEEYDEETGFFILNRGQKAYEEIILGKTYGFIEWLVENEKIDGEKFQEPKIRGTIGLISNWHNSEGKSYKDYSKELAYESLLMHLAIQDEPVRFLISILK